MLDCDELITSLNKKKSLLNKRSRAQHDSSCEIVDDKIDKCCQTKKTYKRFPSFYSLRIAQYTALFKEYIPKCEYSRKGYVTNLEELPPDQLHLASECGNFDAGLVALEVGHVSQARPVS